MTPLIYRFILSFIISCRTTTNNQNESCIYLCPKLIKKNREYYLLNDKVKKKLERILDFIVKKKIIETG